MRIDFVYVTTSRGKIPVNPEALEYILPNNSSTGNGAAQLFLRSGESLQTDMTVEQAVRAFSPMPITGGR